MEPHLTVSMTIEKKSVSLIQKLKISAHISLFLEENQLTVMIGILCKLSTLI